MTKQTFNELVEQYQEFGYIECPTCCTSMEIELEVCPECGWENPIWFETII